MGSKNIDTFFILGYQIKSKSIVTFLMHRFILLFIFAQLTSSELQLDDIEKFWFIKTIGNPNFQCYKRTGQQNSKEITYNSCDILSLTGLTDDRKKEIRNEPIKLESDAKFFEIIEKIFSIVPVNIVAFDGLKTLGLLNHTLLANNYFKIAGFFTHTYNDSKYTLGLNVIENKTSYIAISFKLKESLSSPENSHIIRDVDSHEFLLNFNYDQDHRAYDLFIEEYTREEEEKVTLNPNDCSPDNCYSSKIFIIMLASTLLLASMVLLMIISFFKCIDNRISDLEEKLKIPNQELLNCWNFKRGDRFEQNKPRTHVYHPDNNPRV